MNLVRLYRENKGYTQKHMAEMLDMAYSSYQSLEYSEKINEETAKLIADKLGVDAFMFNIHLAIEEVVAVARKIKETARNNGEEEILNKYRKKLISYIPTMMTEDGYLIIETIMEIMSMYYTGEHKIFYMLCEDAANGCQNTKPIIYSFAMAV